MKTKVTAWRLLIIVSTAALWAGVAAMACAPGWLLALVACGAFAAAWMSLALCICAGRGE